MPSMMVCSPTGTKTPTGASCSTFLHISAGLACRSFAADFCMQDVHKTGKDLGPVLYFRVGSVLSLAA